jgi:anti-sigma B factor antagonist
VADPAEIEVQVETADGATVVRPVGDIDLSRAPALRHHLARTQQQRPARLIIDLGSVPYMDSSGVATLVEAMQVARRHGGKLVLCSLQDRVRSIFEIARLDMVFLIAEDQEQALTA